jgi:hypothetical protein
MTRQEFEMLMLISNWYKRDSEQMGSDEEYVHNDTQWSIGIKEDSDKVTLYYEGNSVGVTDLKTAYDKVNDHMCLMEDLNAGYN